MPSTMTDNPSSSWRDRIRHLATEVREELQRTSHALGVGEEPPYAIVAYRGYGHGGRALVHGRVMESENIAPATAADSTWQNLLNTFRRFDSEPLAHARVAVTIVGTTREVVADNEGFFRQWIDLPAPLSAVEPWHPVDLRLVSPLRADQPEVRATGQLRVPGSDAELGVISDLDDTVVQSRITNFLQAVRTMMLGNARTRLPFPGVAAFYQALERGSDGRRRNPIFYVSSSPWNIYDLIADFMEVQGIPAGPIQLRDWDITLSALSSSRHHDYKEPMIREILELNPALPFILIGDNGQHDPEIYSSIIKRYPGRIRAIYIRNVDANPERSAALQALAKDVQAAGSTLVLADDTYAAASHAAEQGWITRDSLPAIREEKKADEGTTGAKADAPGVPDEPKAPTIVVE
jgi:phosphatidate phosphatase APP1